MSASYALLAMFATAAVHPPVTSTNEHDNSAVKEWKLTYGFSQNESEIWDDQELESPNWLSSRISTLESRGFQRINDPRRHL